MRCAFRCGWRWERVAGRCGRTDIVNLSNGRENRNARWRNARRVYDAGSGVRSIADLYEVLAFFEARMGQLMAFGFAIPWIANPAGDRDRERQRSEDRHRRWELTRRFQLIKTYAMQREQRAA